jgi:uncharacterized protein YgbK (DUF1537 family)
VAKGEAAIRERYAALQKDGCNLAIVDAVSNDDLMAIGAACADMPLVTAGSGLALGLPQNFRRLGLISDAQVADALPRVDGLQAVVSGSCSAATQGQVALMKTQRPAFQVDAMDLARGKNVVGEGLAWADRHLASGPVLVYATESPETVRAVQAQLGTERASKLVEDALARITVGLVQRGVRRLIVAGGETSGAVVKALGVDGLRIGPEIDPGVPWTSSLDDTRPLALALKSGNFGTPDFFVKAWSRLG